MNRLILCLLFSISGSWSCAFAADPAPKGDPAMGTLPSFLQEAKLLQAQREPPLQLAQLIKVQAFYDCRDKNNYVDSRIGYGSCGQQCKEASSPQGRPCPKTTRPIFLKNGDCACCLFPECK